MLCQNVAGGVRAHVHLSAPFAAPARAEQRLFSYVTLVASLPAPSSAHRGQHMLNRHACPTHKWHHFILDTPLLTKKATHPFIRSTTSF